MLLKPASFRDVRMICCVSIKPASPLRDPEALGSSALCHFLEIENFVKLFFRENFFLENYLPYRLVFRHGFLSDLGSVIVADVGCYRCDNHQTSVRVTVASLAVCRDPRDTFL